MDAISILISTDDMTHERRIGMKKFLNLFGNELTLRAGLPHTVIGSNRNDGIFGCREDKKCMHLPSYLQGREALVICTPIKIALPRSCKDTLWKNLKEKDIHLTRSGNTGLCFNPKHAANAPNYNAVIEAIVDSCFGRDINRHVIHIADFGCKLEIMPGKQNCPLGKIFTALKELTQLGIRTEIAQLDFGFTVPVAKNRVVNFSWGSKYWNATNRDKGMFNNVHKDIFPTHHIHPKKNGQGIDSAKLRGSISLKKKKKYWEELKDDAPMIRIGNGSEEWREDHSLAGRMYLCTQDIDKNSVSHMSINPNSVHNVKIYSTLAHQYLQQRSNFMMKEKQLFAAGTRNMKYLLKYVNRVKDVTLKSLQFHSDHGAVKSRVEISIRFPPWDQGMRTVGHYTDHLVHVFLAMDELCDIESDLFSAHYLQPERLVIQVKNMASEVQSYLHFRQSLRFNDVYKNERITNWLRMMLTLMKVTAGLVPNPKLKWIRRFYEDNDRFDPYTRAQHCNTNTPRYKKEAEIKPVDGYIRTALRKHLQELGFSDQGLNLLTKFTFSLGSPEEQHLSVYITLGISDKLLLARWLLAEIVPFLSKFMAKINTNEDRPNINTHRSHHETTYAWQPHHLGIAKKNLPGDAISWAIHKVSGFATFADFNCPIFSAILFKFVLFHHEYTTKNANYLINDNNSIRVELEQSMFQMLKSHIKDGTPIGNADWQHLCTILDIHPRATNQNNHFYIKFICKNLLFPCEGVDYEDVEPTHVYHKNMFLNQSLLSGVVRMVSLPNSHTVTIYRHGGSKIITIPNRNKVLEEKPISTAPCGSGFGYDVLRSISDGVNVSSINARYSNNEKHRMIMKTRLMKRTEEFDDIFITERGHVMKEFKKISSLVHLETKHKFLLEHTNDLSKLQRSALFLPRVIIPICSLVTDNNIAYYDNSTSKTCIYICQRGKCILYEGNTLDFSPRIECFVITEDDGKYTWCKFTPNQRNYTGRLTAQPRGEYSPILMNAQTTIATNIEYAVSNRTLTPPKPIMTSLTLLIGELYRKEELPPCDQEDPLAIISFLKQLYANLHSSTSNYHTSVTNNCTELLLSPMYIKNLLQSGDTTKITHTLICPIICLKYKVLIGVFFRSENRQRTTFYFYDPIFKKVFCRNGDRNGYHTLNHYTNAIYLAVSRNGSCRYFTPTTHLSYFKTIRNNFFHVDVNVLHNMMKYLADLHLMNFQDKVTNIDTENDTLMTLTTMENTSLLTQSLNDLPHVNVEHYGLIIVFPYKGEHWEGCIVHHPAQNESIVKARLAAFIAGTDNPPKVNTSLVKGHQPKECESGLYILMYAVIAHNTKSVNDFTNSVHKVHEVDDLDKKLRAWLFTIYNEDEEANFPYLPYWLEALLTP